MHAELPSSNPQLTILKVGGSLLDLPDLNQRLTRLINHRSGIRPLFIAGGGTAADVVRSWGGIFSLSETDCHDLALQSMQLTASLLERILPQSRVVSSKAESAACWRRGEWPILDVAAWLNETETHRAELPASWDVTSDSLAAWVADKWDAEELCLLKSVDLTAETTIPRASRQGLVDAYFPQIAPRVRKISWCNLRNEPAQLQEWAVPP